MSWYDGSRNGWSVKAIRMKALYKTSLPKKLKRPNDFWSSRKHRSAHSMLYTFKHDEISSALPRVPANPWS
jgi:hypothetical protein